MLVNVSKPLKSSQVCALLVWFLRVSDLFCLAFLSFYFIILHRNCINYYCRMYMCREERQEFVEGIVRRGI